MKKPDDLQKGDWVRWDSRNWEVTDRDLYRESDDYSEVQWELTPDSGPEHYLVRSRENKAGSVEEIWICTRQTKISRVEYLDSDGQWERFRATDSVSPVPSRARYDGLELTLDGETQGTAEDDEGDTVTKLTWDYYDAGRRRNIAIEVWKEPDADYYEAYDGRVVSPSDFTHIPRPAGAGRRVRIGSGSLFHFAIAGLIAYAFLITTVGAIMNLCNTGAEYITAVLLPVLFLVYSVIKGAHRGLLFASVAGGVAAALLLIKFRGLGASYWEYAIYGMLAGAAAAEGAGKLFTDVVARDKSFAAASAALSCLFIVGFTHYVKFAPRPHCSGGLFAACVLPLLPAALIYFIYLRREGSDEQPQA